MPSPVVYVETELLQRVRPRSDFTIADLRLYLALAYKAERTNEAEGAVIIRQPRSLMKLSRIRDNESLAERVVRLQNAGLIEPIDSEDFFQEDEGKSVLVARILNADGSPHTVTTSAKRQVVYVHRTLFAGNGKSDAATLTDAEYVLYLLLLAGVRFLAFGGVDQDFVRRSNKGQVEAGKALSEAYAAATRGIGYGLPSVIRSLEAKGLLSWHMMPLVKLTNNGNKFVLAPRWSAFSVGWQARRRPAYPEALEVLVLTRHAVVWNSGEADFIEGLRRGEYGNMASHLSLADLLDKCRCGRPQEHGHTDMTLLYDSFEGQ